MKKLILFTIPVALVALAINYFLFDDVAKKFTWAALAFFFLLSSIVIFIGGIGVKSKSQFMFNASVSGITLVKIFLCCGFIIAYAVIEKPASKLFIVPFAVFYLAYLIFDVIYITNKIKETKK